MYRTTDFYLAAYLRAAGYNYQGLDFDRATRKATFIFLNVKQQDVLAYYNRTEPRISTLDYVSAVRQTRELLYNLPED
jgi:hypothetical protein